MIKYIPFPPLSSANGDGLLAMGGELTTSSLVSAYSQGIFPWYNDGQPVLWWSPDPRLVLFPDSMKVSRSLKKIVRQRVFTLSCNTAFDQVVTNCAWRGKPPEVESDTLSPPGTWITTDMHRAYSALHHANYAHSVEVWQEGRLVGGLYGVVLGRVFFGESMFSSASNASKIALLGLCQWLQKHRFSIIDCQVSNAHLLSLGAEEIARDRFYRFLNGINIHQSSPHFADGFEDFALTEIPAISDS